MENNLSKTFLLLQINDSLFPIGAYAHSYGLETYIQRGIVHDEASAEIYLENRMRYGILYSDLLGVRLSYEAAQKGDLDKLDQLEDTLEASRVPSEMREASRKLGNRFVKTLMYTNPAWNEGIFGEYVKRRQGKTICHPCAYGVFCACREINLKEAMAAFLYAQASAAVTTCVKSIPLSQMEGQKLLYSFHQFLDEIVSQAGALPEEMLCASAPGFDLRCIQHEKLYSRIYMS